jgi:hypothetical protein
MAYTDLPSASSGRIYDVFENARMDDALKEQEKLMQQAEAIDTKRNDLIRYFIVGGGAILVLVLLRLAVKRK